MALLVTCKYGDSTISLAPDVTAANCKTKSTWSKHPKNEDGSWKSHLIQVTEFDA